MTLRHAPRKAFTVTEILVVLLIIAIIAALLLPAVTAAMRRGAQTQAFAELTQLSMAIDQFKAKYGVYPPSRIRLRENTAYSISGAMADPFDVHSVRYLRLIWPEIVLPNGATSGTINTILWCQDNPGKTAATVAASSGTAGVAGSTDGTTYELEGDECLVFFLGGIPEFDRSNPLTISLRGFSEDPRNPGGVPESAGTARRVGPFFEFDAGRLFVRLGTEVFDYGSLASDEEWATAVTYSGTATSKLPSYAGLLTNERRPIAYFSSYEGRGYRAHDCNYPNEPAIRFQMRWPQISVDGGAGAAPDHQTSNGPNPYTVTTPAPTAGSPLVEAYKKNGFQLITTGGDAQYGQGGSLDLLDPADNDNLTNVADGATISDFQANQAKP